MDQVAWINNLTLITVIIWLIAGVMLLVLLFKANRVVYKLEHLSETIKDFVKDIVPAIVNMGTISVAVQSILRTVADHLHELKKKK